MGQIPLSYLVTANHGKSIPCDSRKGEQSRIFTHRNELKWLTWGSHWPNQALRKGSVDLKPFCLLVSNSEFHSLLKLVVCRTQSTFHLNISKQSQSPVTYDLFIPRLAKEFLVLTLRLYSTSGLSGLLPYLSLPSPSSGTYCFEYLTLWAQALFRLSVLCSLDWWFQVVEHLVYCWVWPVDGSIFDRVTPLASQSWKRTLEKLFSRKSWEAEALDLLSDIISCLRMVHHSK